MILRVKNAQKITIHHSEDIYKIMQMILRREHLIDRTKEHFWTIALNLAHKILNIELVGMGSSKRVVVEPAEVFSVPISKKAACIALIHNHPSGNLQPSKADLDITDRLIQVGYIQDTPVLDHLIITENSYFSFLDNDLIKKLNWSSKYQPSFIYEKRLEQLRKEQEKVRGKVEKDSLKIGREDGLKAGIKEGAKTREIEIAKQMLKKGLETKIIKDITGLSPQQIGRLKNEVKET